MAFQYGFIALEIRHPGFVELEDGLGGFSGNPLGLGVAQGVEVEIRTFRVAVATGQRKVVSSGNFREPRAGGIWRASVDGMDGNVASYGLLEIFPTLNTQPFTLNFFATFPGLHLLPDRQFSPPHE